MDRGPVAQLGWSVRLITEMTKDSRDRSRVRISPGPPIACMHDYGRLGIEFDNINTDGARVSRDFLRKLVENIVQRSTAFHDALKDQGEYDHAFFYGERQFHSVICPSIADIRGAAFLMEHPLNRRPHGMETELGVSGLAF